VLLAVGVVAALLAAALTSAIEAPADAGGGERPNIVIVLTDDQRHDTLAHMPQVQSLLVGEGTRFSNGMVPTALCCPSRASLLTGLYAHHTNVFGNGDVGGSVYGGWLQFHRRGLEFRTLALALHDRGYRTGLFGKYINNFGNATPDGYTPPGWDVFHTFILTRGAYYGYDLSDGSHHGNEPEDYSTDVLARQAEQFIRSTPSEEPVFVYLAPYAPHKQYIPAPRHAGSALDLPPPKAVSLTWTDQPAWVANRAPAPDEAPIPVQQGQVESLLAVDEAVASIMQTLRETGRDRDTLFVFTSDNGYLWGEHGLTGKDLPYDAATRVPLVMRWDGHIPAGVVDDRLALNIDLAATLAGVTGTGMDTDGVDLLGPRRRGGFVLEAMNGYGGRPAYCGWRTQHRMFVQWADGRAELYDYRTDPFEQDNLAGEPGVRQVEERMRAEARAGCDPEPPGFDW
jgi:arylsulfatase A-like enzyme